MASIFTRRGETETKIVHQRNAQSYSRPELRKPCLPNPNSMYSNLNQGAHLPQIMNDRTRNGSVGRIILWVRVQVTFPASHTLHRRLAVHVTCLSRFSCFQYFRLFALFCMYSISHLGGGGGGGEGEGDETEEDGSVATRKCSLTSSWYVLQYFRDS